MQLLTAIVLICSIASAQLATISNHTKPDNWTVNDLKPNGYERAIPPRDDFSDDLHSPVLVVISVHILSLLAVNEPEQSFTVDILYRQEWRDSRLNIPPIGSSHYPLILDSAWKSRIWTPDVYFRNSLSNQVLNSLAPISFIEIKPDYSVSVSARMTIKLSCDMDLFAFPMDAQECHLDSASLTQSSQRITLNWGQFDIDPSINYPKFAIYEFLKTDCDPIERAIFDLSNSWRAPINGSCIRGTLKMSRKLSYYLIRFYAPSFLIVITSFIGFWIPVVAWPGRVTIGVTPLLALITQQNTMNADINVSYVVALHIWTMVSVLFVFMSLIEYAFAISYANHVDDRKENTYNTEYNRLSTISSTSNIHIATLRNACQGIGIALPDLTYDHIRSRSNNHDHHSRFKLALDKMLHIIYGKNVSWKKNPLQRNKIDYAARLLFPLSYGLFMILYFVSFGLPLITKKHD